MRIWVLLLWLLPLGVMGQFDPAGGEEGSRAVHADNSFIERWADSVIINRGFLDIEDTLLGKVDNGEAVYALGKADAQVVSLGDAGEAIIVLSKPIKKIDGYEFAVYENGFKAGNGYFLELAEVAVSSDGLHWVTFAGVSNTDTLQQITNAMWLDAGKLNNLAGKHPAFWGTPFDIDELPDLKILDKDNITHIRITDVIGSVNPAFARRDSRNGIINDPYPTPFSSGGFDLDAVAILSPGYTKVAGIQAGILPFPNPVYSSKTINLSFQFNKLTFLNCQGEIISEFKNSETIEIPTVAGMYYCLVDFYGELIKLKICVL